MKSGFDRWLKPSVDRIDDLVGYTLDNIQLVTFRENNTKSHYTMTQTKSNMRAVKQYDKLGKLIATYHSLSEAGRQTGINSIKGVADGTRNKAGKYIWRWL